MRQVSSSTGPICTFRSLLAHARRWQFDSVAGGASLRGSRRDDNQDSYLVDPSKQLYVVADGMGSRLGGKRASQIAVQVMSELSLCPDASDATVQDAIQHAFGEANRAILQAVEHEPQYRGMGTTIVLAYISQGRLHVSGLGDSRVYLSRMDSIRQLTTDHSVAQLFVEQGLLSSDEARESRWQHVLWRCLGDDCQYSAPHVESLQIQQGDRLLLCSDGVSNKLNDQELRLTTQTARDASEAAQTLVQMVGDQDGSDDATAVVVSFFENK